MSIDDSPPSPARSGSSVQDLLEDAMSDLAEEDGFDMLEDASEASQASDFETNDPSLPTGETDASGKSFCRDSFVRFSDYSSWLACAFSSYCSSGADRR